MPRAKNVSLSSETVPTLSVTIPHSRSRVFVVSTKIPLGDYLDDNAFAIIINFYAPYPKRQSRGTTADGEIPSRRF